LTATRRDDPARCCASSFEAPQEFGLFIPVFRFLSSTTRWTCGFDHSKRVCFSSAIDPVARVPLFLLAPCSPVAARGARPLLYSSQIGRPASFGDPRIATGDKIASPVSSSTATMIGR